MHSSPPAYDCRPAPPIFSRSPLVAVSLDREIDVRIMVEKEHAEDLNLWSPLRKTRVKPEFRTRGAYIAVASCRVSIISMLFMRLGRSESLGFWPDTLVLKPLHRGLHKRVYRGSEMGHFAGMRRLKQLCGLTRGGRPGRPLSRWFLFKYLNFVSVFFRLQR